MMKDTLKRQRLFFVSLVGIVVVSLMMSVTYAYQTIIVEKTEGSDSDVTINVGVLDVTFKNTTEAINIKNLSLIKDYTLGDYTEFTLDNTKSSSDATYSIKLNNLEYSDNLVNKDFKYTVTEVLKNGELVLSTGDFSTLTGTEYNFELVDRTYSYIEKGQTITLRLYLWLEETEEDQNNLEKTSFTGKIEISSMFNHELPVALNKQIVYSAKKAELAEDATRTLFNDEFVYNNITGVSASTDRMLAVAPDDYGDSYFYRGAVKDNYVDFAGFTWRIVRVNGDGSIRLILDGSLDKVYRRNEDGTTSTTAAGTLSKFNEKADDNAYVGFMYGLALGDNTAAQDRCLVLVNGVVTDKISETGYTTKTECESNGGTWTTNAYETTHANVASSTMKKTLETFYKTYINEYKYDAYISDNIFCNDKLLCRGYKGIGTGSSSYALYTRLLEGPIGSTKIALPTLNCAFGNGTIPTNDNPNIYSRYTVEKTTTNNGTITNGNLTYPIGLITADEMYLAGAYYATYNYDHYLTDSKIAELLFDNWYSMTPAIYSASVARVGVYQNYRFNHNVGHVVANYGVRPVINLNSQVLVTGNGTSDNPYKVIMMSE